MLMQLFFYSRDALEHFTSSLDTLPPENACQHCSGNNHWVSHGYIRKQSGDIAGKRILCSQRYSKKGCDKTSPLYLQHIAPQRRYTLTELIPFVLSLIKGLTVEQAYCTGRTCCTGRTWAACLCCRRSVPVYSESSGDAATNG